MSVPTTDVGRRAAAERYEEAVRNLADATRFHEGFPCTAACEWVAEALSDYEDAAAIAEEWQVAGEWTRTSERSNCRCGQPFCLTCLDMARVHFDSGIAP